MKSSIIIGIAIYLLVLIINIFGVLKCHKESPKITIRTLFYYLLFLFLFQIITTILASLGINNLILSHVFFILQLLILAYFFNQIIDSPFVTKLIRIYLIGVFSFLFFQYVFLPDLIWSFNIVEVFITNYLSILLSLIYFYRNLGKKREFQPFIVGVFIYSTLSTSIFLFGNVASFIDINSAVYVWGTHLLVLIVYQLLITFQWFSLLKTRNA